MKTEFFPKSTDECASKYSCKKIRFSFVNPNNPFLEITLKDDKNRFLLWNTILDNFQIFDEATGEVKTQFDISKTWYNRIIFRGNVYNALGVLCKIGLVSKEMFDEIYAGPKADQELKAALDENKHFKLLSRDEQVKRDIIARKPTEILSDSPLSPAVASKPPEDDTENNNIEEEHPAKLRRIQKSELKEETSPLSSSSSFSSMGSISSSSLSSALPSCYCSTPDSRSQMSNPILILLNLQPETTSMAQSSLSGQGIEPSSHSPSFFSESGQSCASSGPKDQLAVPSPKSDDFLRSQANAERARAELRATAQRMNEMNLAAPLYGERKEDENIETTPPLSQH